MVCICPWSWNNHQLITIILSPNFSIMNYSKLWKIYRGITIFGSYITYGLKLSGYHWYLSLTITCIYLLTSVIEKKFKGWPVLWYNFPFTWHIQIIIALHTFPQVSYINLSHKKGKGLPLLERSCPLGWHKHTLIESNHLQKWSSLN